MSHHNGGTGWLSPSITARTSPKLACFHRSQGNGPTAAPGELEGVWYLIHQVGLVSIQPGLGFVPLSIRVRLLPSTNTAGIIGFFSKGELTPKQRDNDVFCTKSCARWKADCFLAGRIRCSAESQHCSHGERLHPFFQEHCHTHW